MFGFTTGSDRQ